MEPDLVSVIMPVFNGERFLQQAIDSMLAQTYPNWELVVVDDGSTDGTRRIVHAYEEARIRYHYQDNRGQAAALNRGLELAQGVLITTLDADDWLAPGSLADRVDYLHANPSHAAVYGDGYYCDSAGKPLLRFAEHMATVGVTGDVFDTLIVSPFYGTGASVLVRRLALEKNNIRYDESIVWCQDWDFYIRLAALEPFGFTPQILVYYRLHEAGMTVSMPGGRRLESLLRLRKKALASRRFQDTRLAQKIAFFYDYLIVDLADRTAEQSEVFESEYFLVLPPGERSRLLRLAANQYLLQNTHLITAREWLRKAWQLSPFDLKTILVSLSTAVNPRLARLILRSRQRYQGGQAKVSPFELAGAYRQAQE